MQKAAARPAPLFAWVLFILLVGPAFAASEIDKAQPGGWVDFVDIPSVEPSADNKVRNGISYLLSDVQIRHRPDGSELFDRYTYRVVDRSGLESGATISFDFNPATQDVSINRLRIIRDGTVLDRLADIQFDIFRREKDAEKGIFDGWLTAYANIPDVRVGDIVDYGKTTVRRPLADPTLLYYSFDVAWNTPVALIRERVSWPTETPLVIRRTRTDVEAIIEKVGTDTVYTWQVSNPEPVRKEDNTPPGFRTYPVVEMSSTASWQRIVNVLLPFYDLNQQLPEELVDRLDAIAAAERLPEDRMIAALRWVQDEIRYVSLSMGRGSFVPRPPGAVLSSGFGDCKDKSLLLALALRHLGIQAEVALTDIDEGQALQESLPALSAFDHAIVKAMIGERTYWLDATNYLQGGKAANLVIPDFGYALPIVSKNAQMEKIAVRDQLQPTIDMKEVITFPASAGDPARIMIETIYRDADADWMRYKIVSDSLPKIAETYLEYYDRPYPGITALVPLQASDDRDRNIISVVEHYELPADALAEDDLAKNFLLEAEIGHTGLPTPTALKRQAPIWLGSPIFRRHDITVRNLRASFVGPEDNSNIFTPNLAFKLSWSNTPSQFHIQWLLKTLDRQVPAANAAAYRKAVARISESTSWTYDFSYADTEAN